MQYSGAQKVPGKIEMPNLPPSATDENGEEPEVQGEGPEVQGEGPEVQGEEPTVNDDDEPIGQGEDETEPEEQPTDTDPRKGLQGGLDIANTTEQALPTAFKITIKFDRLWASYLSGYSPNCNFGGCYPGAKRCADWNLVAYVQGKLVKISEEKHWNYNYGSDTTGLIVCNIRLNNYQGNPNSETYLNFVPSVTVEIPGESVESFRDYRPLSIFTVGWQNDSSTCPPPPSMNAPEELPEVQRILAEYKSSTHSDAREKIASVQHEVQNQLSAGCSPTKPTTTKNDIETSYLQNQRLDTVNILLPAPSYGMELGKDLGGLTEGVYVRNCDTAPYCLSYNIVCPLCAEARQH